MNSACSRRTFLKTSLASTAALSLPARLRAQSVGANGDIRVGIVGLNGRGQSHIANFLKQKGVRIVALCDVDSDVLAKGVAQLKAKGQDVTGYRDLRQMLESKELDAVSLATPNHWHSLGAIWACQSGKDVYVEKPISHNVWEGRQLVKCAAKQGRIVQTGVQSRSATGLADVLEWVQREPLGKLQHVRGLCYKRRASIGKVAAPMPWPEQLDQELWFGPAEIRPLMREKVHYDWHWIWNTGNGDLGNQGIHQMDIARRFLREPALSPAVWSVGGRVGYVDDGETPNSLIVFHDYPAAPLIFEVRGLPAARDSKEMDKFRTASIGVIAQYADGYIVCPDYSNAAVFDNKGELLRKFGNPPLPAQTVQSKSYEAAPTRPSGGEEEAHFANFVAAMRSRKADDLNGQILDGHISSALCHTANISHRLGKPASPEKLREKVQGNAAAAETYGRLAAHLEANGIDLDSEKLVLGEYLKFDPVAETFPENPDANALLKRTGRGEFTIPEQV